jgi:hypothetical protein
MDVVLSSDDDGDAKPAHSVGQHTPTDRDTSATDDNGGAGITSAEATIPGPDRAGVLSTTRLPTTDQVPTIPPSGVHGWKRLCLATK